MNVTAAKKFFQNKIRLIPAFLCMAMVTAVIFTECNANRESRLENGPAWFGRESKAFAARALALKKAVSHISDDTLSVEQAREALRKCRLQYKRIAFFMEYFFPEEAMICNGPPQSEVEDAGQEYRDPAGLQVIEGLLYSGNSGEQREQM